MEGRVSMVGCVIMAGRVGMAGHVNIPCHVSWPDHVTAKSYGSLCHVYSMYEKIAIHKVSAS